MSPDGAQGFPMVRSVFVSVSFFFSPFHQSSLLACTCSPFSPRFSLGDVIQAPTSFFRAGLA